MNPPPDASKAPVSPRDFTPAEVVGPRLTKPPDVGRRSACGKRARAGSVRGGCRGLWLQVLHHGLLLLDLEIQGAQSDTDVAHDHGRHHDREGSQAPRESSKSFARSGSLVRGTPQSLRVVLVMHVNLLRPPGMQTAACTGPSQSGAWAYPQTRQCILIR